MAVPRGSGSGGVSPFSFRLLAEMEAGQRRRANGGADLVRSEADLFSGVSGSGPDGDASRVTA